MLCWMIRYNMTCIRKYVGRFLLFGGSVKYGTRYKILKIRHKLPTGHNYFVVDLKNMRSNELIPCHTITHNNFFEHLIREEE